MLVLTRRVREEIVIGEAIRIVVTGIRSGTVRVGIIAPGSVRVDRQEVHQARSPRQRPAVAAPSPATP